MDAFRFCRSSDLAVDVDVILATLTLTGVNAELSPLVRMTAPAAFAQRPLQEWPERDHLFTSWILLLGVLPVVFGLAGIPLAALAGVICTALLLMQRQGLLGVLAWARQWLLSAGVMGLAALVLFRVEGVWLQLGLSTLAGAVVLLGMGLWLKPWRKA